MTATIDVRADELFGPDIPLIGDDCRLRDVRIRIENDQDPENPLEWDRFKLITRTRRHATTDLKAWESMFPDGRMGIGIATKLKHSTAWFVDYFEHGSCRWSISGQGPQCQWDNTRRAGILLWTGRPSQLAGTAEKRDQIAARVLDTYTSWCNGDAYGYVVEDADTGEHLDSCWGYIGDYEYCLEEAKRAGNFHGEIVETKKPF